MVKLLGLILTLVTMGWGQPTVPVVREIVSMGSSTQVTIAAHTANNGAVLYTIGAGTCDISAGSGTAYIQESPDGVVICGHNGLTLVCNANCTVQAAVTGPINGYKQLGSCAATAGAWTACTDTSRSTGFQRITNGTNLSLSYDADGTAIPALSSTVDLTSGGLIIPNSNTVPGSCTVGAVYKKNDGTSGQQLYACEGGTFVQQIGSTVTKVRIPVPIVMGSLNTASTSSVNCAATAASMADADMTPAFGVKFAHTGTPSIDCVYRLPLNWDGTALSAYLSVGPNSQVSGTTGILYVTNVCVAAGSTYSSGTFGGSVTYTFTGLDTGSAVLREATGDITPDAGTCVAGRTIKFRIERTGGVGADDFNPGFNLTNFQIGVRVNLE